VTNNLLQQLLSGQWHFSSSRWNNVGPA